MSTKPDITRLIELQQLLQQLAQTERMCERRHHGSFVHENDTEHSYNLAMTAWFLAGHFPHLDRDRLIRLALVHDLLEVHAGDTPVYADEALLASKHEREVAAVEKLRREWQDFPELLEHIDSYESRESEEAKFVYALDKIMPIMLIYINDGRTWQQEGVTLDRLDGVKQGKVNLHPAVKVYYDQLYALLEDAPHLISPR